MPRDDHFETFEEHTLLKHFLLTAYIKRWAVILSRGFSRVWFIDAFAGAGSDRLGRPGSPVRAGEVARAVNQENFGGLADAARGMYVVAIEAHKGRHDNLVECMRPFTSTKPPIAFVRHGTLEDILDRFLVRTKGEPRLYFLDPFGVAGLRAELLSRILAGSGNARSEILEAVMNLRRAGRSC